MWWEEVAKLAYKMAMDCGQAYEFFEKVEEWSTKTASQQKISQQKISQHTAMSTLLGDNWSSHRKRGRDPIRRISQFNGLLDDSDNGKEAHPESVLVKRSKSAQKGPVIDIIGRQSVSPMSILRNTPVDIDDQPAMSPKSSLSPVRKPEKLRQNKPLPKEMLSKPLPKETLSKSLPRDTLTKPLPKEMLNLPQQPATSNKPVADTSPFKTKSPEKKQSDTDFDGLSKNERKQLKEDRQIDEKKFTRTGKPGMAEKRQNPKKRRSSSSKVGKEYKVNRLKGVKESEYGELVYLVEWKGDWDDTWEPYHCVANLNEDIKEVYKNASSEMQAIMRLAGHLNDVESD